jgi:hypothetical protein
MWIGFREWSITEKEETEEALDVLENYDSMRIFTHK